MHKLFGDKELRAWWQLGGSPLYRGCSSCDQIVTLCVQRVAPAPTPQASGFPDASQRLGTQVDVCVAPVDLIVNRPAEYAEKVGQTAKGYYIDAPIALGKQALNLSKTVGSEAVQFATDPLGTSIRYGKIATGLADTVADAVYHYDQTWDSIEETVSSLPKTIDDWIVHTPLDKQGQFFGEIGWSIPIGRAAEVAFTRAFSAARWVDDVVPDARGPAPASKLAQGGRRLSSLEAEALAKSDALGSAARLRDAARSIGTRVPSKASTVVDAGTGRAYHGISLRNKASLQPTNIHPELARRMPAKSLENWRTTNCAEFGAVNRALHDGARWSDLRVYTVDVPLGVPVPRCSNCAQSLDGLIVPSL